MLQINIFNYYRNLLSKTIIIKYLSQLYILKDQISYSNHSLNFAIGTSSLKIMQNNKKT